MSGPPQPGAVAPGIRGPSMAPQSAGVPMTPQQPSNPGPAPAQNQGGVASQQNLNQIVSRISTILRETVSYIPVLVFFPNKQIEDGSAGARMREDMKLE